MRSVIVCRDVHLEAEGKPEVAQPTLHLGVRAIAFKSCLELLSLGRAPDARARKRLRGSAGDAGLTLHLGTGCILFLAG